MTAQEEALKKRLAEVENPDWYLQLLGLALEKNPDLDAAMRVADRMVEEQPQPPETEGDRELKALDSASAIDDYASTMRLDPAEPAEPAVSAAEPFRLSESWLNYLNEP